MATRAGNFFLKMKARKSSGRGVEETGELGVELGRGGGGRSGTEAGEVGAQLGVGGSVLLGHVEQIARQRRRLVVQRGETHGVFEERARELLLLALVLDERKRDVSDGSSSSPTRARKRTPGSAFRAAICSRMSSSNRSMIA